MPSPLDMPERSPLAVLRFDPLPAPTPALDLTPLRDSLSQAFPNRRVHTDRIEVAVADYERNRAQWYAEQGIRRPLSDKQYRMRRGLSCAAITRDGNFAWYMKLGDLPTRRGDPGTGEILDHGPVRWTGYEKRIWIDRVGPNNEDRDKAYYERLRDFGFVELSKRTAAEKRKWGKGWLDEAMLSRAQEACETYERSVFITDLDDWTPRKIEERLGAGWERAFHNMLHFNLGRWRHHVREGVFPDIPEESRNEDSVHDCITVAGAP